MDIRTATNDYWAELHECFEAGHMDWDDVPVCVREKLCGLIMRTKKDTVALYEFITENGSDSMPNLLAAVLIGDGDALELQEDLIQSMAKGALDFSEPVLIADFL